MKGKTSIEAFFLRFKNTYGAYRNKPGLMEAVVLPLSFVAFILSAFIFNRALNDIKVYNGNISKVFLFCCAIAIVIGSLAAMVFCMIMAADEQSNKQKKRYGMVLFFISNVAAFIAISLLVRLLKPVVTKATNAFAFVELIILIVCLLSTVLFAHSFPNIKLHRKTAKNLIIGSFLGITIMLLLVNYLIVPLAASANQNKGSLSGALLAACAASTNTSAPTATPAPTVTPAPTATPNPTDNELHEDLKWLTGAFGVATILAAIWFVIYDLREKSYSAGNNKDETQKQENAGAEEQPNKNKEKTLIELTKDLLIELDLYDRVSVETIEDLCKESVDDVVLNDKKERIGLFVAIAGLAISGIFSAWAEEMRETDWLGLNVVVTALIGLGYTVWLAVRVRSVNKEEEAKEKREILHIMRRIKKEMNNKEMRFE